MAIEFGELPARQRRSSLLSDEDIATLQKHAGEWAQLDREYAKPSQASASAAALRKRLGRDFQVVSRGGTVWLRYLPQDIDDLDEDGQDEAW